MSFTNIKEASNSEHQKVWHLLPWYINHSLDPAEHAYVKSHVKTCIACRIELNQQQHVHEKMQQSDHLQQVSQVSFTQLRKRMGERPESKKVRKLHSHQFHSFIKYVAIAASLLLVSTLLIFNPAVVEPELTGEYRTLANSTEENSKNNIVRVVFSDQLDAEHIEALLNSVSGRIVQGPSNNNIYDIHIGHQQEFNDAISYLRENPGVIFAEPAR